MNYTVDDFGLILGLVSVPSGVEENDFYEHDIAGNLVREYKTSRMKSFFDDEQLPDSLYNPIGFKTFGDNDLMFYSLFDDFAYPNRVFHPFHGNGGMDTLYRNFDYQLVVGLNAFDAASDRAKQSLVTSFAKDELDTYIFTCATRFKINPVLLCGTGLDCVRLIKSALHGIHQRFDGKLILLNGVGCDELIMLNFSNDICAIAKFIYQARNLNIENLEPGAPHGLYDIVRQRCMVASNPRINICKAHVFSSAYSLSGYAFSTRKNTLPENLRSTDFSLQFTWDVKPGHIGVFTTRLQELLGKLGLSHQDDKLYINKSIVKYSICGNDVALTSKFLETIDELRGLDIEKNDMRKMHVMVFVEDDERYLFMNDKGQYPHVESFDPEKHPYTRNIFRHWMFTPQEMSTLRKSLDSSRISKALKERIMKMYQNFNDCVQDPQFVVSFIGLKSFLKHLIDVVDKYANGKKDVTADYIHEWLDNGVRDFEQAYLNRFHQSNRMRTLSDFNLEWNGGIQQLICSMDFAYKTVMKCCGLPNPHAFMYVSGHDRIHVNDHAYRINMQHITYPELFASTLWKEFFNFMPTMAEMCDDRDNLALSSIMSDRFVHTIKEKISIHLKFNHANPTHRVFLNRLDKEYRTSVIADLMTFYYGYNASLDDFTFWYIRYFLQTPGSYNRDGTVYRDNFIIFFCRIMIVYKLIGVKEDKLEELRFNPPDPSIADLWIENFSDALTIASLMNEILVPFHFVGTIKTMVTKMLNNQLNPPDTGLPPARLFNVLCNAREDIFERFRKLFESNVIDTSVHDAKEIGNMLPGFLKYLRGMIKNDKRPCIALTRTDKGYPNLTAETAPYYCPLLADPLGGSFSIDTITDINYFKARSVLYLWLFHFYQCNMSNLEI